MIWPALFVMNMALLVLPSFWRTSPGQHYLQQKRTCNRGIMLYKIQNKQVEIPILPTKQTLYQQWITIDDLSIYSAYS